MARDVLERLPELEARLYDQPEADQALAALRELAGVLATFADVPRWRPFRACRGRLAMQAASARLETAMGELRRRRAA